ncbi:uncharacterized protein LOC126668239 [Mercurialis annua]|uniref:uncharacterized protein LOC126668239 n=1 Tax=Mercurialis annua TaxID=3986 RepID=UPI002160CD5B|nr:uncharacterized protein LOC126668239 [Mercurialis annua]
MRMALLSKNKLKFVDGSIAIPSPNDRNYESWERCNNMVISWLYRALTPSIAQSVSFLNFAVDIWENLRERFSQGDADRIADLQYEICSLKQNNMSISEYYTNLKILWDEFINFRPIPSCSCTPKCECGGYDLIKKYQDNDYVIRFIKGLNDNFETVRSHILLLEPLPPINKAFSMALRHERQQGLLTDSTEVNAFAASSSNPDHSAYYSKMNSNSQRKFFHKKPMLCSHCGLTNHTVDRCYRKHGFPPGFLSKYKTNTPGYANQVDSNLTDDSHEDYDHSNEVVPLSSANSGQWNHKNAAAPSFNTSNVAAPSSNFPFTPEHCSQLIALLQQKNDTSVNSQHVSSHHNAHVNTAAAKFSSQPSYSGMTHTCLLSTKFTQTDWLVDFGATNHIVCSLDYFDDYRPISGVFINLPNNKHVRVTHIGTVTVFSKLILKNALFKIHTWKKIGLAKKKAGLHHLAPIFADSDANSKSVKSCFSTSVSSIDSNTIWHYRLGHLSNSRIKILHFINPSIQYSANISNCDICHFSK